MPDDSPLSPDPVIGDGVITFPGDKESEMDLPTNVGTLVITESAGNLQANNRDGRNVGTAAMGVLQGAIVRRHDELDTVESKAHSGVIATPIASPATQQ